MTARARPIATRIFALTIGAVAAATAVLFFVTYSGPPPIDPPRPLVMVADALRGRLGPPPGAPDEPRDRSRSLRLAREARAPAPQGREARDPAGRRPPVPRR